jgi:hypothetical protein
VCGTVISVHILLDYFWGFFKKKKIHVCIFFVTVTVTCDNFHIRKLTCVDSRNKFPFKEIYCLALFGLVNPHTNGITYFLGI